MKTQKRTTRPVKEENLPVRLNKYLADAGIASRRKADELIQSGAVKVNGKIIIDLGTRIKRSDTVSVNGNHVKIRQKLLYILLNKPKDCISTASDEKARHTIFDIVRKSVRLFPVGRLDRNTTGALLMTNDGELAHKLTHPKYQIERIYNVGLAQKLKTADAQKIADGLELEDGMTAPCEVFINPEDKSQVTLSLTEGKNREVRRIFESLGYQVKKLDRKIFAGLTTRGLNRGEYRTLLKKEIEGLKKLVGM